VELKRQLQKKQHQRKQQRSKENNSYYMHDPKHNNHINGLLIIIATLFVGGALWFIISSTSDTYTRTPTDVGEAPVEGAEELYQNEAFGFNVRYDKKFKILPNTEDQTWRSNVDSPGTRLLTLELPREIQPNTNFSDATITVGVSVDGQQVKNCLIAENGEVEAVSELPAFKKFTQNDAAAGNFYEVQSYRLVRNSTCFAVERILHSTNILNYDPSQGVTEFDRSMVNTLVERVIKSFRFTK
jgi:hypothetical protein